MNGFAGLYGFVGFGAKAGILRQFSRRARQSRDSVPSPRDRYGLYSSSLKPNGVFAMSHPNQTQTPFNHSEAANTLFQMATIAAVAIFSVLALLNAATQIV